MMIDPDGEGELELLDDGTSTFPEGFVEPKAGSIVKVGERFEMELVDKLAE